MGSRASWRPGSRCAGCVSAMVRPGGTTVTFPARGVASRRMALIRRAQILSVEPAGRHDAPRLGRSDQGTLGMRAGSPATERGTRPRPFRRAVMDRPAPTCADGMDRLRLSPAPAPRRTSSDGAKKTPTRLPGPPPAPSLPAVRQAFIGKLFKRFVPPFCCPHCQKRFRLPSDIKVPRSC